MTDTSDPNWEMVDFISLREESELVSDLLWSLGVVAIEERDTNDETVTLRTSMGSQPEDAIAVVLNTYPHTHTQRIEIARTVADTWREHAVPTWVNETVALVPAWVNAPPQCVPIFIEPLDTFGLGNHPTTVLALQLALRHVPEGSDVFDLGCGSGVLAVALAKIKNCSVDVYDIAANAQETVKQNCQLNSVDKVSWTSGLSSQIVTTVLANILSPVLIEFAETIQNATRIGGYIILSGMRSDQVADVVAHYSQCTTIDSAELEAWTAVVLQKN